MAGERIEKMLGEICQVKQGKYLAPEEMSELRTAESPIPVYGASGILGYTDQVMFDEPVALVTCRGSNCGMLQRTEGRSWISNNAMACPPKTPNHNRYVYYLLLASNFSDVTTGSAQPQITATHLNSKPLKISSDPNEQEKIASVLGALDDKIELNRQMNKTLEALAQSIFKSWFVDFDPVHAKAIGKQLPSLDAATADLFPDSFQDSAFGEIPKDWKVGTLADLCSVQGGFAYKSSDFISAGHPVIKIKNITADKSVDVEDLDYVSEDVAQKTKDFWLKDGDLVIAMTGATVGKFGLLVNPDGLPCILNQRVGRFFPRSHQGEQIWFIFCALSRAEVLEQIISVADGSAQPNISAKGICSAEVVVPPDALVLKFNQRVNEIFTMLLNNKKEVRTLASLRDALLPKLLEGEILVSK